MKKIVTKHCLWPWEIRSLLPSGAYGIEQHPEWDCEIYFIDTYVSEWEL